MNKELEQAKKYIEDNNLSKAYEFMGGAVNANPEFGENVLETMKIDLQSDKNNGISLGAAYDAMERIVTTNPELGKDALETMKAALQSDKNDAHSLMEARTSLETIAGMNPELEKDIFEFMKNGVRKDNSGNSSTGNEYNVSERIASIRTRLGEANGAAAADEIAEKPRMGKVTESATPNKELSLAIQEQIKAAKGNRR